MNQRFSYSRNNTFKRCAYQHDLRYAQLVRPKVVAQPLRRGSLIHKGIEACLRSMFYMGDPQRALEDAIDAITAMHDENMAEPAIEFLLEENPDIRAEMRETWLDALSVTERVITRMGLNDSTRWKTVALEDGTPLIEHQVEETLPNGDTYIGFIDWVAIDVKTGYKWLVDFKTRKALQNDEFRGANPAAGSVPGPVGAQRGRSYERVRRNPNQGQGTGSTWSDEGDEEPPAPNQTHRHCYRLGDV